MTLRRLAELTGMTYQQTHKYELGANRIAAARLHAMALALGTNVAFFFDNLEPVSRTTAAQDHCHWLVELTNQATKKLIASAPCTCTIQSDLMSQKIQIERGCEMALIRHCAKGKGIWSYV